MRIINGLKEELAKCKEEIAFLKQQIGLPVEVSVIERIREGDWTRSDFD
jgi:hypothetical protein